MSKQAIHYIVVLMLRKYTDWHEVVMAWSLDLRLTTSSFWFWFWFCFSFLFLSAVRLLGMEFFWMDWAFFYLTGFDANKALFFEVCVLVFLFLFLFLSCQIALHSHTHTLTQNRTDRIRYFSYLFYVS